MSKKRIIKKNICQVNTVITHENTAGVCSNEMMTHNRWSAKRTCEGKKKE